ncbi:vesicle-associated protein 2-2-like isoform X2 [Trifolium pratense]|uniref:vesicle-associated protein 2-2-like isoform X2 n=1 Tax=Trifolium pratense TaxID=57577 RepID=UPI001E694F94|nr:vesicle-associated protein 2-2-like isoform X2 [Trifolium pratense]
MNRTPILEIEPRELKFIFELKKQSSCSVKVTNNTYHHVAFKVKTTSPKKYSVRPNVGVLAPKSTAEFIVTMQAQRVAPEDLVCKDKFLVQSTLVSNETTDEDVTSNLFVKDGVRYIEENKLKVALISSPDSPELVPFNGNSKNGFDHEKAQMHSKDELEIQSLEPMVLKKPQHSKVHDVELEEDMELNVEYHTGLDVIKDAKEPGESGLKVSRDDKLNPVKGVEELKSQQKIGVEVSKDLDSITVENAEELKPGKEAEVKVSKDLGSIRVKNAEELKAGKKAEMVSNDPGSIRVNNADELKPGKEAELKVSKDYLTTVNDAEALKPEKERELKVSKDTVIKTVKNVEELEPEKEPESRVSKGIEELKLLEAIEEMKLKLDGLESKLNESGVTISKLTEERRLSNQETRILQEKLADLLNKTPRKVQVGFPLLYVCMVALICVVLGYRLHS